MIEGGGREEEKVEYGLSLVVQYKAQYFTVNYSACLPLIEILWMGRSAWCGGLRGGFEVKCKCVHISVPFF